MKKTMTISGSVRRCATAAFTALTALLLGACADDDMVSGGQNDAITVTTTVAAPVTRATGTDDAYLNGAGNDFLDGTVIRLYAPGAMRDEGGGNLVPVTDNYTALRLTAANMSGTKMPTWSEVCYWPIDNTDHADFHAYYPANLPVATVRQGTKTLLEVPAEQGNTGAVNFVTPAGIATDILYAEALQLNYGTNTLAVPLTFRHKMARVSVTLQSGDAYITDDFIQKAQVIVTNLYTRGYLDNYRGTVTAVTDPGDANYKDPEVIILKNPSTHATAPNTAADNYCVLPPGQSISQHEISIIHGTHIMGFSIPNYLGADLMLRAGVNNHFTLTITSEGISAMTYEVLPWDDADPVAAEANSDANAQPLTIEATAGGSVAMAANGSPAASDKQYQYRKYTALTKQWSDWTTFTPGSTTVTVASGDMVQLRGNNRAVNGGDDNNYYSLTMPTGSRVSGNIMSLLYGITDAGVPANFATQTAITVAHAFRNLFRGATVKSASGLVLPATTLAESCYQNMFQGCTTLEKGPRLPALTMALRCYRSMFYGCTALKSVPDLPATTLATDCYYAMFSGCTSLTAVPVLPATTMTSCCYQEMFANCTGLTTVPDDMLPATNLYDNCYKLMFSGCSNLVKTPYLPATTLATDCYRLMFQNCTSLNEVRCNATNISATDYTYNWLYGVNATGTFYKNTSATTWPINSVHGIPSGWNVETY